MEFADALTYREAGNKLFVGGDVETAIVKYQTSLGLAAKALEASRDDSAIKDLILLVNLNLALCFLKTEEWNRAKQHAIDALEINSHHPKGLYRAAVACLELGEFNECATHLNELFKVERSNKEGHALLTRLRTEVDQRRNQQGKDTLGAKLTDSIRVVSEFAEGNDAFEDVEALTVALQILCVWVTKTGRSNVLTKDQVAEKTWVSMQRIMESSLETITSKVSVTAESVSNQDLYMYNPEALLALETGIRLCLLLVLEVTDRSEEAKGEYERQEALRLNTDIRVDDEIKKARQNLRSAMDLDSLLKHVKKMVAAGVSDISEQQAAADVSLKTKLKRSSLLSIAMELLHYIGDLEDSKILQILSEGINTVECRSIQQKALTSLAFLADRHRRKGLTVKALKLTHGLQCCLESLAGMLEYEGEFAVDAFDLAEEYGGDASSKASRQVEYCLTAIFHLLADKERAEEDAVSWSTITDALIAPRLRMESEATRYAAYQVLNILWLADRQEVFRFSLYTSLPTLALDVATTKTFEDPRLQKAAAEYLLNAMEFPELRTLIVETDGVSKLIDVANKSRAQSEVSFRCQLLAVLGRLSVHSDIMREMIFDMIDFIKITGEIIDQVDFKKIQYYLKANKSKGASLRVLKSIERLLEILFFVSLHADFKRELLGLPQASIVLSVTDKLPPLAPSASEAERREYEELERKLKLEAYEKEDEKLASFEVKPNPFLDTLTALAKFVGEYGSPEASFMFAGLLHNLTRSDKDKDRLKKTKNSPDFDEGQMQQLQYIYDQLPSKAKPQELAAYYRGGPNLNLKLKEALLSKTFIIPALKTIALRRDPPPTSNLLKLCSYPIRQICQVPQLRAALFKQGGFQVIRKTIEGFQDLPDEVRDLRQTIAHFAMSINPINFSYSETMGMVADLLALLEDPYELFAYEAALGLTNLVGVSEDARSRVWNEGKGMKAIREIATSDNELLRAAGVEIMCNLFVSDKVKRMFYETYIESQAYDFDLTFILSLLMETDNARAWTAAAGALSIMSQDCRLALCIARHAKFQNAVSSIEMAMQLSNEPIQLRLVVFLTNVWKSIQWLLSDAVGEEFADSKYAARMLVDEASIQEVTKQLFLFFGMLDALLKPQVRNVLKEEVTLYTQCPIMPLMSQLDGLPPAVASFWSDIAVNKSSKTVTV
eukprot:Blabericola_migrator_1__2753@NODE_1787_length_3788_cov_38_079817_g1152_i0_p1_GENE_NODE_1787_length_3788_cov_38_079817_g1152_i0NODE_1787_length_3788_cov_38_079817_g1152_i0_p1_ORF_typecomplete_len1177_score268_95ANAPC3/PF12895_7/1_6e08ANAPC3/PF12895_7/1_4e03Arm_2/PF04826_13/3_5e02Arm_2/PF04826_13/0_0043Arm_2/PF04826_13/9_4TPR_19/PF14559_6/5_6TPR_19/PF14559_6/0_029TPR_19/PF14559_6/1e04Fis1_TPR_C/PF14853_6/68Fis1_TPR_C/PF14853_6/0_046TPR_MalT/PF17874_1/0_00035TPR_MalT/PF17874_1/2_3e03TPR_MalT/PF1787